MNGGNVDLFEERRGYLFAPFLAFLGSLAVILAYITVPSHSGELTHFDTLIVLGAPPNPDGKASSEECERVTEAVRELRARRSVNIIMSGGAVTSRQPESEVMAGIAQAEGVPSTSIIIESKSRNTIENIYYSNLLMQQNGWSTAEVISSPSHLRRASLILARYPFGWQTRAAHWPPEYTRQRIAKYYLREVPGTVALRWFGFRVSPFIPH